MKPLCESDRLIGNYMEHHNKGDFSAVLSEDERLEPALYLSELPVALFGWYPFDAKGRVLQIGSWFGAFTEMLCLHTAHVTVVEPDPYRAAMTAKRLSHVDNLTIVNASAEEYCREACNGKDGNGGQDGRFDYVIFAVDEKIDRFPDTAAYTRVINAARRVLREDGKLLFAVPNRFGAKYFCGEPDPSTDVRFDGITEDNTELYRFSRAELVEYMQGLGFAYVKLYYPLPDHHHPQLIYTDEFLPDKDIKERLRIFVGNKQERILNESALYGALAQNDVIPFFSNSFLVEAGSTPCSNVVFSAVSAEREKDRAFATNLYDDGTAAKLAMYPEGKKGLARLQRHTEELAARGIPVLKMEEKQGALSMRRIPHPSLSIYLRELLKQQDVDAFLACLDKLWKYILLSSDPVSPEKNCMRHLAPEADFGVILEKAYIEMIPVNCFCDKGEFLFYDQEFARENCPAGYVMFRTVRDIYDFIPETRDFIAPETLKKRYGLTDTWEIYRQEELRFQRELRRRNVYSGYHHWLKNLPETMKENRRALTMPMEEKRTDYFEPVSELEGKRIVLFGSGQLADYYFDKFGKTHPPVFIVDNNEEKCGGEKNGIAIKEPSALSKLMYGTYRVVVAIKNYRPVVQQLEDMGIHEDSYRVISRSLDHLRQWKLTDTMTDGKYDMGYVTGVFDLFHIGHLNLLKNCKARCHYLVAGVLTDELTERDKHKTPFIPFEERLEIVRQCKYVDRVIPVDFSNTNKVDAWKSLRYGCLFSGNDHEGAPYWTWLQRELRRLGSDLEFFPYTRSTSSSMLQAVIKGQLK